MGYSVFQLETNFVIHHRNFQPALDAIKSLKGQETCGLNEELHFMWINDSNSFLNAETLEDALSVWRWPVLDQNEEGDVIDVAFSGENYGDEDLLFSAISPYVRADSFITMAGENGLLWRWFFTGQVVRKDYGRLLFDEKAQDQGKMRDVRLIGHDVNREL